jgi:hypothetical protein
VPGGQPVGSPSMVRADSIFPYRFGTCNLAEEPLAALSRCELGGPLCDRFFLQGYIPRLQSVGTSCSLFLMSGVPRPT